MKNIPPNIEKTFRMLRKEYQGYIQLQFSNGSWCVRRATSVWDKEKRKPKKIVEHIGVITLDGKFKKKIPRGAIRETTKEVFEFGNGALAHYFLKDIEENLRNNFSYPNEIIACGIIKSIDPQPIKLLASRWEKLYLSQQMSVSLSPKHISSVLNELGSLVASWYDLFMHLSVDGDIIFYDLSRIFTYSENIKIAEKGYNTKHLYLNQIGITMAFSSLTRLPIAIEVYPGSMKEAKIIRDFRKRFPKKDIGFVFDRGFTDYKLLDELKDDKTHYIVPLKKGSRYMDFTGVLWKGVFIYRKRPILWGRKEMDYGYTYFFDDPKVRGEQEAILLKRVEKGEITLGEFKKKRKMAGIIGLLSDLDKEGKEVYDLYKGKEDVELTFDALNNFIDSDKTYLRKEEAVRGYYFISFVALRVYFNILKRLREKELSNKISVYEVFLELSKIIKIKERSGREYFAAIPKKTKKIMGLFPEVFDIGK